MSVASRRRQDARNGEGCYLIIAKDLRAAPGVVLTTVRVTVGVAEQAVDISSLGMDKRPMISNEITVDQ